MTIENPPAFPSPGGVDGEGEFGPQLGMTLRDHFAGCALSILPVPNIVERNSPDLPQMIARRAYAIADAMLAERMAVRS